MDSDSLFDSVAQKRKDDSVTAGQKRFKLKRYDHLSAQALKPFGVSDLEKADLKTLWSIIVNGSKTVKYFAEWPDKDPWRKGIAVSRLAEVMTAVIKTLKDEKFARLLDAKILQSALDEATNLETALAILNAGKGTQATSRVTLSNLGAPKPKQRSQAEVATAAGALYAWLKQPKSTLRGLMSFMAQGGVFYAGSVAEKAARAYVLHGEEDENCFIQAAITRACSSKDADEPDNDQEVLFTADLKEDPNILSCYINRCFVCPCTSLCVPQGA